MVGLHLISVCVAAAARIEDDGAMMQHISVIFTKQHVSNVEVANNHMVSEVAAVDDMCSEDAFEQQDGALQDQGCHNTNPRNVDYAGILGGAAANLLDGTTSDIIQNSKAVNKQMAKATSSFAKGALNAVKDIPGLGTAIGFITDIFGPDPNEERFQALEDGQACLNAEVRMLSGRLHCLENRVEKNEKQIQENEAAIAKNAQTIRHVEISLARRITNNQRDIGILRTTQNGIQAVSKVFSMGSDFSVSLPVIDRRCRKGKAGHAGADCGCDRLDSAASWLETRGLPLAIAFNNEVSSAVNLLKNDEWKNDDVAWLDVIRQSLGHGLWFAVEKFVVDVRSWFHNYIQWAATVHKDSGGVMRSGGSGGIYACRQPFENAKVVTDVTDKIFDDVVKMHSELAYDISSFLHLLEKSRRARQDDWRKSMTEKPSSYLLAFRDFQADMCRLTGKYFQHQEPLTFYHSSYGNTHGDAIQFGYRPPANTVVSMQGARRCPFCVNCENITDRCQCGMAPRHLKLQNGFPGAAAAVASANESPRDVSVTMHNAQYGHENSWSLSSTTTDTSCDGSGYSTDEERSQTCHLLPGTYQLNCFCSYSDGWHGGYITVQGQTYCGSTESFSSKTETVVIS